MQFKGVIKAGEIAAIFESDFLNEDPDLLILGYTNVGGSKVSNDQDVAMPGGQASTGIEVDERGRLEVIVATGPITDSGRLIVSSRGEIVHDEPIVGPVHWVYSVEAERL